MEKSPSWLAGGGEYFLNSEIILKWGIPFFMTSYYSPDGGVVVFVEVEATVR